MRGYSEYGWLSLGQVTCEHCGYEYHKRVEHPKRCPQCQRWIVAKPRMGGSKQSCPDCNHTWTTRRGYASKRCPACHRFLESGQNN